MKLAGFVLTVLFVSEIQLAWADAFILDNGIFTTFNVPGANPGSTLATGVNDSGQVAGFFTNSTGTQGFLDTDGVFTAINFPGAALTQASGINNVGQIVGGFQATLGTYRKAFSIATVSFRLSLSVVTLTTQVRSWDLWEVVALLLKSPPCIQTAAASPLQVTRKIPPGSWAPVVPLTHRARGPRVVHQPPSVRSRKAFSTA